MNRLLPGLLLLALAACGGRIEADPEDSCSPPAICARPDWGYHARGTYLCEDGAVITVCCGYTLAELEGLAGKGDVWAKACLADE